ncbi:MAG: hypothetical protein GF365_02595 [Candidatus Buchananbacteria bacterium]|nr:hypothetical protein [Candidatus Buchananbacteria bacterium]
MYSFTLDHNAIIDLEEKREQNYLYLSNFLIQNFEQLSITAVSASENPPIRNFSDFKNKILSISELKNIKDEQILKPLGIYDFSYYDWCLLGDGPGQPMIKLKEDIISILFPNLLPIHNLDYKARNNLADVMTFWCHVYHKKKIFVTSDNNFHKKSEKLKIIAKNFHGNDIQIVRAIDLMI